MQSDSYDFNDKYKRAIVKTAIGFYIINHAGVAINYSADEINISKWILVDILANNIAVSRESIYEDACRVHDNLPMQYISELHETDIIDNLIKDLFNLEILKIKH